ncbi:metallophosphoesterase [Nanoarchaeota archaeon]
MKILAIGDPHGHFNLIKKINLDADLILVTGDIGKSDLMRKMAFENQDRARMGLPKKNFSNAMRKRAYMESYRSAMKIVRYLSKKKVFVIFGNADYTNYAVRKLGKRIGEDLPKLYDDLNALKNVSVINNRIRNFNGVRIGGLEYFLDVCWAKEFNGPMDIARVDTKKVRKILNWFGKVDILLCHQPPYGVLDKVSFKGAPKHWKGKKAGSKVVLDYIKRKKPSFVFCGHIHEGEGYKKVGSSKVYNLGICGSKIVKF